LAFTPNGALLSARGRGGTIALADIRTRRVARRMRTPGEGSISFSATGALMAAAANGAARTLDVATGTSSPIPGPGGRVVAALFGPTASSVVLGTWNGEIALWRP